MNGSSSNKKQQAATCWMALAAGRLTRFQSPRVDWCWKTPAFLYCCWPSCFFSFNLLFVSIEVLFCSISSKTPSSIEPSQEIFPPRMFEGLLWTFTLKGKNYSLMVLAFRQDWYTPLLFSSIEAHNAAWSWQVILQSYPFTVRYLNSHQLSHLSSTIW